jgi:opacity protein-like surface antigen
MKRLLFVSLLIAILLLAACTTQATSTINQKTIDITGAWSGDWQRSDGGEEGILTAALNQSGSSLSGDMTFTSTTFSYSQDTSISGSVEGYEIVFGMAIGGDDSVITIDFEGTISEDGNKMSGDYSMSTGYTGTWSVTRE